MHERSVQHLTKDHLRPVGLPRIEKVLTLAVNCPKDPSWRTCFGK